MKINEDTCSNLVRIGTVHFGSIIKYENSYWIVTEKMIKDNNFLYITNLKSGELKSVSLDIRVEEITHYNFTVGPK